MEKVDTILFEITSLKFFLDFYVKFISNIKLKILNKTDGKMTMYFAFLTAIEKKYLTN